MWYVYIAESISTKKLYVGITKDPTRRIVEHNSGKGSKFAIDQGPLELVSVSASYPDQSSARIREVQVKKWRAEKKRWLIEGLII